MHDTLQKNQYVEKRFRFDPGKGTVKETDDDDEDRKQIRMPVSSSAEDRDGDEFSREGLEDMKDQIDSGRVPMFLDHGRGAEGPYYGTLGIVGRWDSAEIETNGDVDVLYATGTPATTEPAEKMTQLLEDDMPVGSSVGFRILEYERDEEENKYRFHGVDLLEISQVGIPSNPVTVNTGDDVGIEARGALGAPRQVGGYQHGQNQIAARGAQPPGRGQAPITIDPTVLNTHGASTSPSTFESRERRDLPTPEGFKQLVDERIEDLEKRLEKWPDGPDTQTHSEMTDDNDGGDDPANDPDDELREAVSEQTDAVRDLVEGIDSLLEERDTEPEEEDEADAGDADVDGKDTNPDEETVQLFVGDEADEDVRKEFEALREKANDDGEIDLADSETRLFGSDDEGDSSEDNGDSGTTGVSI